MKTFIVMLRREMYGFFLSPLAMAVSFFFLVATGFGFWLMVFSLAGQPVWPTLVVRDFFGSTFFWINLLALPPLLAMRLLADERRWGTLETLMTAPVEPATVVLAKFIGALLPLMALWLVTRLYFYLLGWFLPPGALDAGVLNAAYVGVFLVSSFFLSLGLLCSACTTHASIAMSAAFSTILIVFFFGYMPPVMIPSESWREALAAVSCVQHLNDFARGLVESRTVVFYVSSTALMLFAATRVLGARGWR